MNDDEKTDHTADCSIDTNRIPGGNVVDVVRIPCRLYAEALFH